MRVICIDDNPYVDYIQANIKSFGTSYYQKKRLELNKIYFVNKINFIGDYYLIENIWYSKTRFKLLEDRRNEKLEEILK